jgi:predicted porin
MNRPMKPILICSAIGLGATGLSAGAFAAGSGDTDAEIQALKNQVQILMQKIDRLSARQEVEAKEEKGSKAAPSGGAADVLKHIEFYGHLDMSVDDTTKGLDSAYPIGGSPVGKVGWMPAISTNLSYLGLRGKHDLGDDVTVLFQLETQVDVAATSGTTNTNSNSDSTVKGALTSRNSYLGLAGKEWGAIKIGKTDAPYKTSTGRMNPFSGMIGDYSAIMGNTGGDNRVEFGTRIDHAVWYESPKFSGFNFDLLYAPGQNRSTDNSLQASGESSCAGGNIPGSGALSPSCNDGSFGAAYSYSASYTDGPLYLTGAYELHRDVNRTSDLATPDPNDIADESAWKVGVQYKLPTKTTISAIYEDMKRDLPSYLDYQNERTRKGYWLALVQEITPRDNLSVGWAHADASPGDPGQHNTTGGANPDNAANMYTLAYKHHLDPKTYWYATVAETVNHRDSHYDLGAGGRAITTDCHDALQLAAFDPTANNGAGGVTGDGPHCFAGGTLKGVSLGLDYSF